MRSPGKTRSKLGLTLGCCAVAFVGLRLAVIRQRFEAWLFPSDVAKSAPSRQATVASTGRREVLAGHCTLHGREAASNHHGLVHVRARYWFGKCLGGISTGGTASCELKRLCPCDI
eukprot:3021201-Amphidinium_carterae.1